MAYIVGGWALAQGVAQVLPVFAVPVWVIQLLVVLIILGLPVALGLAWAFELTPEGLKRTEEVDDAAAARQKARLALRGACGRVYIDRIVFSLVATRLPLCNTQRSILRLNRSPFCRLKI